MYCRNCGNDIDEHMKFCPKCGIKIIIDKDYQARDSYYYVSAQSRTIAMILRWGLSALLDFIVSMLETGRAVHSIFFLVDFCFWVLYTISIGFTTVLSRIWTVILFLVQR